MITIIYSITLIVYLNAMLVDINHIIQLNSSILLTSSTYDFVRVDLKVP